MKIFNHIKNPFILFSPFLVLFVLYVLKFHTNTLEGDEGGYMFFANNLLQGFYSPAGEDFNLWWGPGYPILLLPFIVLNLPLITITLLNAVFQYLSIVFLFKSLTYFIDFKKALGFSLFWAFCYSSYSFIAAMLTEIFITFLITLLMFFIIKAFLKPANNKYVFLSGLVFGYIALSKVIFGYVIMALLLGSFILWILNLKSVNYKKSFLIVIVAFAVTIPYLTYTYNLTGKPFYWGNSGGMSLYWMSTPYENEYGDWNNEDFNANVVDESIDQSVELIKQNHQSDIEHVQKYKGVERDEAYKKLAVNNIKNYPVKYVKNIISNISRAVFGFPHTYTYQHPLLKIWYFAILYTLMLLSAFLTLVNWKKIDYTVRFIFIFVFVYLGGSFLLSIYYRQFIIVIPAILFWIAVIFQKTVTVKIKIDSNS